MNAQTTPLGVTDNTQNEIAELSRLYVEFGAKYHVDPNRVGILLNQTAFKQDNRVITKAEMIVLLIVASTYNLNPFTREIYAFADLERIVPVVGVDGWSRMINNQPSFDGMTFIYADATIKKTTNAQECSEWIECHMHRKDRAHPVVVREYLDENFIDSPHWTGKTRRMLRHKAMIQCARYAFGFVGIADHDDVVHGIMSQKVFALAELDKDTSPVEAPLQGGLAQAKQALAKLPATASTTTASTEVAEKPVTVVITEKKAATARFVVPTAKHAVPTAKHVETKPIQLPASQLFMDIDEHELLFEVV